jgi:hypothetical protein
MPSPTSVPMIYRDAMYRVRFIVFKVQKGRIDISAGNFYNNPITIK